MPANQIGFNTVRVMPELSPAEFDAKLTEAIRRLRECFSPTAIYLYGWHAYGTPGRHSDIDLLVIVDNSPVDPYERDAAAYRALGDISVPIDVQVYTHEEFEERPALPVSFERTVKQKGKIVHAA